MSVRSEKKNKAIISSKLLAKSWRVKFIEDTVRSRSGKSFRFARFYIPNFALVVAIRDTDKKIPLVRQFRHGARKTIWEFPAGILEPKENHLSTIKREFREETGYELKRPRLLTTLFPMPARTDQRAFIYVGKVGRRAGDLVLDDTEELEVRFFGGDEALRFLKRNASSTHLLAYYIARESNIF